MYSAASANVRTDFEGVFCVIFKKIFSKHELVVLGFRCEYRVAINELAPTVGGTVGAVSIINS